MFINLSENFLLHYGLTFKFEFENEVKQISPGPSVKVSHMSISKDAALDKNTVATALNNLFHLIGELLAEGRNLEIDLGPFGKLKALNKNVTYSPPSKQKHSTLHGKVFIDFC